MGPALRKIALPGCVLNHLKGGDVRFYLVMPPTVPARPWTPVHLCPPIPTPDRGCFCTSDLYASSGRFVDDRGVRSIVKRESMPHKGSGGPTLTPLLFFWKKKNIIFGYAVVQIVNTYTSHLENVPTSLPATAPELDRQRARSAELHSTSQAPLDAMCGTGNRDTAHPHPKKPMELRPSRFPRET